MFCHNCGTELTGTTDYCPNCGAKTDIYFGTPTPAKTGTNLGLLSMIFGIVAMMTAWIPVIPSWAMAIAGLVLGIVSLAKKRPSKGMAIAGIVCSALALLFFAAAVVAFVFAARVLSGAFWESFIPVSGFPAAMSVFPGMF